MGHDLPLRVLFVSPYPPSLIRTRSYNLINSLVSAGHRLTLATPWENEEDLRFLALFEDRLENLITVRIRRTRAAWNCLRAALTGHPMQAWFSWSPRLAERLMKLASDSSFDVIHAEHIRGARYALELQKFLTRREQPRPAIVWDSVDCISGLYFRAARQSATLRHRLMTRIEAPRTAAFEAYLLSFFDRVLVSAEADHRELMTTAKRYGDSSRDSLRNRIVVIPNGVDTAYFSPSSEERQPNTIAFTGKVSYHANVTAVLYFAKEVMPLIWQTVPDACFWIVGKNPPREVNRLSAAGPERILVTGTVEDIRPFLKKASTVVVPIKYGAGSQLKMLEAMACETPVAASSVAATPLGIRHGEHVLVADDPVELAGAVTTLLKNPELGSRLGKAARAYVERHHDWTAIGRRLAEVYRETASAYCNS
jgi:polysaccharide biosynthesis protein PslH